MPETEYEAIELASWVSRDGRMISLWSARDITEPLLLSEQNGTTLRHALKGHGLPVSGTKRQQAVRLANAGVSGAHVESWHTWRGRDAAPCAHPASPPDGCDHTYPPANTDGTCPSCGKPRVITPAPSTPEEGTR